MEAVLVGVASTALTEGVKFLYQQAGEVLSSWRARRRDAAAKPPVALSPPPEVTLGEARPLPEAPDDDTLDALQELKDLLEPIKDGEVALDSSAAREVVSDLRDLLEAALRAPITFVGEPPRPVKIEEVRVVTQRVSGRVTGLRISLAELQGADVGPVVVETGDVAESGEVIGADLTKQSRAG